jgi:hypothetical protein
MATATLTTTSDRDVPTAGIDDLMGVKARISWGAILAGAVMALAIYFLLTLLGAAVGISISDEFAGRNIANGAAVYAIAVTAVCLFVGGIIASQLTAGEQKGEAVIYGLLVWAVVFAMLLWLMATGVKAGFNTMVGVATAGTAVADATARNTTQADWEAAAQRAGVPQERINEWKATVRNAPADAKAAIENPENKAKAEQVVRNAGENAARIAWWSFAGTLISMLAAAAGGYVGAGPNIQLFAVPVARAVRTTPVVHA